jgi:hypothetical protein
MSSEDIYPNPLVLLRYEGRLIIDGARNLGRTARNDTLGTRDRQRSVIEPLNGVLSAWKRIRETREFVPGKYMASFQLRSSRPS